jgi:hypothetical protein
MRDLIAQGLDLQGGQRVLAAHPGSVVKRRPGTRHHLLGNRDRRPVGRDVSRSGTLTRSEAKAKRCGGDRFL